MANAVTGELTSRVFSGLIQRYGKDAATSEKLQRLEILLIKINSAVEVTEKRTIGSSSLLQWRDKLKEAASQGDEVLASFPHRPKDAQATGNTNNGNQQQGEAVSSSAAAPSADVGLSFTRNCVTNMVQGIGNAGKMLFSSVGDDMEMLNRTLGRLEKLDIGEFIRLLHLDGLPKVDPNPYGAAPSTKVHGPTGETGETREKKRMKHSSTHSNPSSPLKEEKAEEMLDMWCFSSLGVDDFQCDLTLLQKEQQVKPLRDRLEAAFGEIRKAVDLADRRDLQDLEWLACWAGILREAKEQGRDVLSTTSACKTINMGDNEEHSVEFGQEEDELGTFVHRLEGLARDVEYFRKLVYLCPRT